MKQPFVLLVNPYIYDFAAYNYWSKPLGLLYIGGILRKNKIEVLLIDCMEEDKRKKKEDGRSPYVKEKVKKPDALKEIKRPLRRYGISPKRLVAALKEIPNPDMIFVSSSMTYWYLGTKEVVHILKEIYPSIPIVVGGIYPSLCWEHAQRTLNGADLIVSKEKINTIYTYLEERLNIKFSFKPHLEDLNSLPLPAFDLYESVDFVPLLTSLGCVFRCTYCATNYLYPKMKRMKPKKVLEEISYWVSFGVRRFVLYDDCFLADKDNHAVPILRGIATFKEKVEIYNPNALNAVFIDDEVASLLSEAGFMEVRLGLESLNPFTQINTGGKVDTQGLRKAVSHLMAAGFKGKDIHIYLLAGLPNQRWEEVKESIDFVLDLGCTPHIAEYAPCPKTEMFEKNKRIARFPIDEEPLFHNNTLMPFAWSGFTEDDLQYLKSYLRQNIQRLSQDLTQRVPHKCLKEQLTQTFET
ncbi:MAG: cobalamin-dependent protein [Desulfobacterota bacterium]|nr:cobalamin-dependent protein [Thermodesulfobacteriota bacterium]MDW8001698.1 cobalamin-dependent protein [Deltaproteobacteria bacterium]